MSYHNADGPSLGIVEGVRDAEGYWSLDAVERKIMPPKDDPLWPAKCDGCDYHFTDADERQVFTDHIFVDANGKEHSLRKATPGMMWDAWYCSRKGPDGRCLVVMCPYGHEWMIDSRASNCTMKDDNEHRCWIRHGEPPNLIVDKNGKTLCGRRGRLDPSRQLSRVPGISRRATG